jgi:2-dehydro-3-deoxygalactonokinase
VDPGENFWYLSGVLVGSEVAALRSYPGHPVTLCAPESLRAIYEAALGELGLDEPVTSVPPRVVEESAAWGQLAIFRRLVARRELA